MNNNTAGVHSQLSSTMAITDGEEGFRTSGDEAFVVLGLAQPSSNSGVFTAGSRRRIVSLN